jgi:hypothetical protein
MPWKPAGFACGLIFSLLPLSSAFAVDESQPVQLQIKNVQLHVDAATVVHVRRLRGELVSTSRGQPPTFDDRNSFRVKVDSGEIAIGLDDLSRLLNNHTFGYEGAPLKKLTVTSEEGRLKIKGTLSKGINVPFTIVAEPRVANNGALLLHTLKAKAFGFVPKGLMSFLGIEIEDLIRVKKGTGVTLDGDDFVLDPAGMLPPPRIEGRLQAVRVESNRLVQVFGPGKAAALRPPDAGANYMYYRGGILKFGKLTMTDADMQLIDQNPADPFDFFQERYKDQLVAGYSKNTPEQGLKVFMPDYYRVKRRS